MKITALTCSTGRPECLELCRSYVARQTRKVDEHIVQEGGDFWQNMRAGLARCTGDIVVIFEDDDWYAKDWVEQCVTGLIDTDLFGQKRICNYHVITGGCEWLPPKHGNCAMHSTAFRSSMLESIKKLPQHEGKPQLDVMLWSLPVRKRKIDTLSVVAMKGMPGLGGYSQAHSPDHYVFFDKDGTCLRWLVGEEDAAIYRHYRIPR